MIALRHLREQVAVIVPDVRLLVGPRSCTCTSPFTSRQSCHVSSPYFKQLILGLWFGFCFTFHELLGLQLHVQLGLQLRVPLQLRRLLRWSSIGAREGFCLLCLLSLEPWINKNFFKGQGQQVVWRVPHAGLLLRALHHSSRRMALRYFTLSSSLCAETIGGAWEVRLEKT